MWGCGTQPIDTGTVKVSMTDAPAAVDAINLVITEVSVRHSGDSEGWEVISSDSRQVDLLTLRNGVFTDLGIGLVPAGDYEEMRFKLGEGCTIVIDGVIHPLTIPSGLSSGFKLKGHFSVPNGGGVTLLLDFDAESSVHQTGNGTWILEPVVRMVVQTAQSSPGAIRGGIFPPGTEVTVYAIAAAETLQRTMVSEEGAFVLSMLPAGTYTVALHPTVGYMDATLSSVVVAEGQTTDVGTTNLQSIE
jgi:hypothetical protein